MVDNNLDAIGIEAVDAFLRTFNSRDVVAWAGSLNFPHVRPSPMGKITPFESEEHYIAAFNYDHILASGWDHSEWDYRKVIHTSAQKIHVAGQWTRYTATGERLLSTPIVYIVTQQDDKWGIQSRFGADYVEDGDTNDMESRGFKLIHDFINRSNEGHSSACTELVNYPHYDIRAGDLNRSDNPTELILPTGMIRVNSLYAVQTGTHSMNAALDISLTTKTEKRQRQLILNLNDRDGHLGIQAWSLLNPHNEEP